MLKNPVSARASASLPLAAAGNAPGTATMSPAQAEYFSREAPFFRDFARQFSLDPKVVYLMAGQKGSQPASVRQRYQQGLDETARDPYPVHLEPTADTRARIASGYGASVDEIAISRNTADALSQVLMGIEWQRGDEILVSPMEHPAGMSPVLRLSARFGVRIVQWGVPVNRAATADEVVEAIRKRLRPGVTRAIFFSSPMWPNGQRLPERRIAALAQEAGAITVADGAHYGGMIEPRLDESGIDFWAISGHKWQCGPGGTGILYIRNRLHPANSTPLPRFHIIRSSLVDMPHDGSRPADFDIGAAMSKYGFPESADWRALGDVCAVWDEVGRARIQAWTHNLADYLRQRIAAEFGDDALLQPAVGSGAEVRHRLLQSVFRRHAPPRSRLQPAVSRSPAARICVSHRRRRRRAQWIHPCARSAGGGVSRRPDTQPRSRYARAGAVRFCAACQRLRLELR